MAKRINPRPSFRLLKIGEKKPKGYQVEWNGKWTEGTDVGGKVESDTLACRVQISMDTKKGIATRATVRTVFAGQIATEATIRSDVGLSLSQMEKATEAYEKRVFDLKSKALMPEYIMLEIQRDPNDC